MKRRVIPSYRNSYPHTKTPIYTLKDIREKAPWFFSRLDWEDRMMCVAWVVLKYVLYEGEEWSINKKEKDMSMKYRSLMTGATKNDKKFIGNLANQILRLGGYHE